MPSRWLILCAIGCAFSLVGQPALGAPHAASPQAKGAAAACGTLPCSIPAMPGPPCDVPCLKARVAADPNANFWLGVAYANGLGVTKDLNAAATAWDAGAHAGNALSTEAFGELSERRGDYENAAAYYRTAAKRKVAVANYYLAALYEANLASEPNAAEPTPPPHGTWLHAGTINGPKRAFGRYLEAAQSNVPSAYVVVAMYYAQGTVVTRDCTQAVYWYKKALTSNVQGAKDRLEPLKTVCPTLLA